jgi:hypothetical protein
MTAQTSRTVAAAMFAFFGAVGGQPAEAIAQTVHFTAAPIAGPTPLIVRFCASAGISIDFGDGTSSGMQGGATAIVRLACRISCHTPTRRPVSTICAAFPVRHPRFTPNAEKQRAKPVA